MNEDLITYQLGEHEKRLNNHSERLDKIEQDSVEFKTELKNLCDNLKSLTSVIKWFIGIWVTTLLGFFIFSVEKLF